MNPPTTTTDETSETSANILRIRGAIAEMPSLGGYGYTPKATDDPDKFIAELARWFEKFGPSCASQIAKGTRDDIELATMRRDLATLRRTLGTAPAE